MNGNAILFVKVIDIALAIIKDNTYDNDINVNVLFLNFRWTFLANIEEIAANRLNIAYIIEKSSADIPISVSKSFLYVDITFNVA